MRKWKGLFRNTFPPLEARHEASGFNTLFNGDHLTFSEYISRNQAMIRKVCSSASPLNLEKAVNGNSPFTLEPAADNNAGQKNKYRRGILLTHGLSDSPCEAQRVAVGICDWHGVYHLGRVSLLDLTTQQRRGL